MIIRLLALPILLLLLSGCNSKRYFEPQEVVGEVSYSGDLPAEIVAVSRQGAVLENRQIITSKGLQEVRIGEEMHMVGADEEHIITAADCGDIRVIRLSDGDVLFEKRLDNMAVSASLLDGSLAVVMADNSLALYSITSGEELYRGREGASYANDVRIAAPFFLKDILLYPTLDGKIAIVDRESHQKIRDIIVDDRRFFNNVIFLDVFENRLVAATQNRVISVAPDIINTLDNSVRDVVFIRDGIYVLTRDGEVLKCDSDLNVVKKKKFPFAHFVGAIFGNHIYSVEKQGYLIALDVDMIVSNVYELDGEIDGPIFINRENIYYKNRYFQLKH